MGLVIVFIFSMAMGIGVGQYYLHQDSKPPIAPKVLSEQIENTPTPTETPTPTPTPTLSPTPAPTLTPTAVPTSIPVSAPAEMDHYFNEYAEKYRVDANLLKRIANCESHFNTAVVSRNSLYAGMFQFTVSTWQSNRIQMGKDANPDLRFGASESIETAAYLLSVRGPGAWPACSK